MGFGKHGTYPIEPGVRLVAFERVKQFADRRSHEMWTRTASGLWENASQCCKLTDRQDQAMAVPLDHFLKQLGDSGLLADGVLEAFVPPQASPQDAEELACELVRHNKLTAFQADEILRGEGKQLVLGNYVLLEKIGAGGMGQVFKAEHRRMKRVVALKLLPTETAANPAAIARFAREVEAAAKVVHPNIVAAYDSDCAQGIHFLVMEFAGGSDLFTLVRRHGPLAAETAIRYVLQAARGLEAAHAAGIVHRDIKPANLLVDATDTVKVLDMGLARLTPASDAQTQDDLTGSATILGTIDYMAPEQALSTKHADARADIYSLGCSLYYLLTGKAMYGGDSVMQKLLAHRESPIPELRGVQPNVSAQLEATFRKMAAKSVDDRQQSMAEVIEDLERCLAVQEPLLPTERPGCAPRSAGLAPACDDATTGLPATLEIPSTTGQAASPRNGRRRVQTLAGTALLVAAVSTGVIVTWRTLGSAPAIDSDEAAGETQVWNTPAFRAWMQEVRDLPAEEQVRAVANKLVELNPGFDGTVSREVEEDEVVTLKFFTDHVTNIAPVRALTKLKNLDCKGSPQGRGGILLDLSPLSGMSLEYLVCFKTRVADLSPLRGMPLKRLQTHATRVSDLSPLEGSTSLAFLNVTKTKVTGDAVRSLQKALPNCQILWDDPAGPSAPSSPKE